MVNDTYECKECTVERLRLCKTIGTSNYSKELERKVKIDGYYTILWAFGIVSVLMSDKTTAIEITISNKVVGIRPSVSELNNNKIYEITKIALICRDYDDERAYFNEVKVNNVDKDIIDIRTANKNFKINLELIKSTLIKRIEIGDKHIDPKIQIAYDTVFKLGKEVRTIEMRHAKGDKEVS